MNHRSTETPASPLTSEPEGQSLQTVLLPALEGLYDMGRNDGENPPDEPETQDQRANAAINLTMSIVTSILSHRAALPKTPEPPSLREALEDFCKAMRMNALSDDDLRRGLALPEVQPFEHAKAAALLKAREALASRAEPPVSEAQREPPSDERCVRPLFAIGAQRVSALLHSAASGAGND